MSKSTTYQIINKTTIPGQFLGDALEWLRTQVVAGGTPSGPAGGVLSGTYPNPGFAEAMATQAYVSSLIASREPALAAGTIAQYYRGDKSWQTLDKAAVGLPAVNNTSDADKPISTATAAALAGKQATLVSGTNIKTINSQSLLGSGDIVISGGGGSTTVEDVLTSTSAVNALSANQGRVLKGLVDGKVNSVAGKGLSTEDYTTGEKNKLAGIAAGATANSPDATLLARANHTGTQAISTVSGLQGALDGKEASLPAGGTTAQYLRGDKTWTDFATSVRAALLTGFAAGPNSAVAATDSILQAIQKLQAQISAGGGGGGATIKAIQRGTVAIAGNGSTASATITAVDTAKVELRYLGGSGANSGSVPQVPRLTLTNSTTVTVTTSGAMIGGVTVSWELTEWN